MGTKNYEKFPDNIFKEQNIMVGEYEYRLYLARFKNLYDLYDYLKGEPEINRDVFYELSSETNGRSFAGVPYEEAVESLLQPNDPGYTEFLQLQADINQSLGAPKKKYVSQRKVVGSHVLLPAYSAGSAKCYTALDRANQSKFIRLHIGLSYNCQTKKDQVFNRALITTNIIKALENRGYIVDLHASELSRHASELIQIVLDLKKYDGSLDMDALYKSTCKVEFLRRILFRILETMDVRTNWSGGYGRTCDEDEVRRILNLDKDDIYIGAPNELEVEGESLTKDFKNMIEKLNLQNKIDYDKAIDNIEKQAKILKR